MHIFQSVVLLNPWMTFSFLDNNLINFGAFSAYVHFRFDHSDDLSFGFRRPILLLILPFKLCGDNGIRPEDDADPKVCPSSCGGAACDPVTRWIGLKTLPQKQPPQSLVRRARFTRDISGSIVTDSDYWTGLLGGCGVSAGCDASIGGRLRNLMEQYLELQIQLVGAVQAVYRAESLILKVSKNV